MNSKFEGKDLERLTLDYMGMTIILTDTKTRINFYEGLRHIGGIFPKEKEQKDLERKLKKDIALFRAIKKEISQRLEIKELSKNMSYDEFYDFLAVNFFVQGNKVEKRKPFIMPSEITLEMLKEAAREADRRAGHYVAPEKKTKRKRRRA